MAYDDEPLDTKSVRHWEGSVYDALRGIPGRIYKRIRQFYGTSEMGELAGFFGARYARLERDKLPKNIKDLLGSLLASDDKDVKAGKYERAPAHDREPYDKDGGYDRQGFSRS